MSKRTPAYQATERIGELFCNKLSSATLSVIEGIVQLAINDSQKETSKNPAIQEAVYKELGTYEKLQQMHGTIDTLSAKLAAWQPIIDKMIKETGKQGEFRAWQELLTVYRASKKGARK